MSLTPTIALSIGDCTEDLEMRGFGPEHLDLLAKRLCRRILRWKFGVSYGGILRDVSFLRTLCFTAQAMASEEDIIQSRAGARRDIVSFQPWPNCVTAITSSVIAENFGLVRYVRVNLPQSLLDQYASLKPSDIRDSVNKALMAASLTELRKQMAVGALDVDKVSVEPHCARIVVGGKPKEWLGFLPGIAEEVLESLEAGRPVYLIGGYGGMVERLCRFLQGEEGVPELNLEFHLKDEKSTNLRSVVEGARYIRDNFKLEPEQRGYFSETHIAVRFEALLQKLESIKSLKNMGNGLSWEDNCTLMKSENVIEILSLLKRGLEKQGYQTEAVLPS